ncbi:YraN family protein [Pseudomonadales bacterium]|nr:YraN family protein [Pseudomonadales bacterium]
MTETNIQRGNDAENRALEFLETQGLRLVTRNFLCKVGEIDLIVRDQTTVIFVEVRYRQDTSRGTGAETVTRSKMIKIINSARYFLTQQPIYAELACRFDVISISASLDWIQNAFTLDDTLQKDSR